MTTKRRQAAQAPQAPASRKAVVSRDASGLPRLKKSTAFAREMEAFATEQFGGADQMSPFERTLFERFAHIRAAALLIEERVRNRDLRDVATYVSLVDRMHGIAKTLGIKRRQKSVGDYRSYLASKAPQEKPS